MAGGDRAAGARLLHHRARPARHRAGPGPATGYDKPSLAGDVRAVARAESGDAAPLACGHDMDSFVAFAYALANRDAIAGLMMVDAPSPGIATWDLGGASLRAWHIAFHAQVDAVLMLVTGRERAYIRRFIVSRAYDPQAVSEADIDVYAAAYAAPGALRAAFQMYRALALEDAALNRAALAAGRLAMPVTPVSGATLPPATMRAALDEGAVAGRIATVERAGHWIAEERPDALAALIREWTAGAG